MANRALTTRIKEDTYRRIKLQSVLSDRSIEEIVEAALTDWLDDVEISQEEEA